MKSIRIRGASEHNLKNVSIDIPRGKLTVFTGVSGSGKSSLAFDTIYREGRRRFLESLSAYARRFLGGGERPRVERIEGLSPAVAIEQRTLGLSPRSTVGTITEIHDHLRLAFARLGVPHCPGCGRPICSQSADQVVDQLLYRFAGRPLLICAPVVRDRRGEHRKVFERLRRDGFTRVRIDGAVMRLGDLDPELDRRQAHTIDVVYDRQPARSEARSRLVEAVERCFALAGGVASAVVDEEAAATGGEERQDAARGDLEHTFSGRFACPDCGIDLPELEPRLFSFNSPHGMCPACGGLGETPQIDPELLVQDPSLPFRRGGIFLFSAAGSWLYPELDEKGFRDLGKRLGFRPGSSWGDLDEAARRALLEGDGRYAGLLPMIEACRKADPGFLSTRLRDLPCRECGGTRLAALSRAVRFEGWTLPDLAAQPLEQLEETLAAMRLEGSRGQVGGPILEEIRRRLRFLLRLGLGYLTLQRGSSTLSVGEAQRLRLARHIGADLQGVIVVLDEPSIGLHPRDHRRLVETLGELRDRHNTVLVVEHDEETIRAADHVVDLGPAAGSRGGEVVAEGSCEDLEREPRSLTGAYLSGLRSIRRAGAPRSPRGDWIELLGVRHNNLRDIDVRFPLGLLVAVTGVSGSGKSSLVNQVLKRALRRRMGRREAQPGLHRALLGAHLIDKLVDIDQSPIGRSPRSNPATYTRLFNLIRDLFASLPQARARGYAPRRFSFNADGGRCADCGGSGMTTIDMQFLAPVEIVCDACGGRRYNRETLEILYRGRSIGDVLEMTVEEARELFASQPRIVRTLEGLAAIGLGYVRLGQPVTTLSGGESQRLKLVGELQKRDTGRTL
ncbi:MAG: excinuclease ABC subunit UvrA, partial [Planctomycetes bacterium]|nr:excinuclease ABC subunit UvrA [Planctomycetota bacterium]